MAVDRLQGLLSRFSVSARLFHSGPLCGINDFADNGMGQLHLVRRGPLEVRHAGEVVQVTEPSLLFYPRPLAHRFISDDTVGADMACANLAFGGAVSAGVSMGATHPIARSLPPFVGLPLTALPGAAPVLELLFDEAFAQRCGRQIVVDRLFDDSGLITEGPLAGLGHPQLAKALVAMHDEPANPWTLETLAAHAGMSRSRFAEVFSQVVGETPAAYLAQYRITLAQQALLRGEGLERIAHQVGYGSSAALSRAFSAVCGVSPRGWRRSLPD
ncbi:MAG: AraC family transcriptional regulator [Arenimonas sp. SCN 70-307]|uniref:AraC family transcriptional regulator n=1 Tax=Arenimonas sp. SCN 70-307 TaxID=1660089 RepID=UPI00086E2970|nr:AraC family transcriptional regulator [Arenimonas sp. SCN 70-307]ODS63243.1 MAG: AraC family transcriptional regulator [Arenimonas sp. SCN 70-307]